MRVPCCHDYIDRVRGHSSQLNCRTQSKPQISSTNQYTDKVLARKSSQQVSGVPDFVDHKGGGVPLRPCSLLRQVTSAGSDKVASISWLPGRKLVLATRKQLPGGVVEVFKRTVVVNKQLL